MRFRFASLAFGAALPLLASSSQLQAFGLGSQGKSTSAAAPVVIASDSGGVIIDFAMKLARYRREGNLVEFSGRCDSSCTLFLSLPRSQTCISPGAYFRFHAPSGASPQAASAAKAFLMSKYPGWVRSWISARGGLTGTLIRMDYSYASKFLRSCRQDIAGI